MCYYSGREDHPAPTNSTHQTTDPPSTHHPPTHPPTAAEALTKDQGGGWKDFNFFVAKGSSQASAAVRSLVGMTGGMEEGETKKTTREDSIFVSEGPHLTISHHTTQHNTSTAYL